MRLKHYNKPYHGVALQLDGWALYIVVSYTEFIDTISRISIGSILFLESKQYDVCVFCIVF